jgi:hypothetical protein
MRRLSSSFTSFCKRVLPVLWCGVLLLVLAVALWSGLRAKVGVDATKLVLLLGLVLLAGLGRLFFRELIFERVGAIRQGRR